ncbi:34-kDa subunit of RNA polymerase III (C), partial [Dispira parvispora]
MSVMDNDERIIYQHIEAADNEGIWLKRIKARVGLPSTTVTRCVKRLEQKLLIKAVTSVKNPTQKIYMLYDLTPSVELTGGPWYTDQELDVDFIETLSTQCYKFILSRSFPSNKPGAVYGPEHSFYPTAGQVRRFIMEMAISTVDLSVSDVQTLLSVLVYDGKVERLLPAAEHMDWDSDDEAPTNVGIGAKGKQAGKKEADYMYKAIRNKSAQNALVTIPCGQCPVYNDCCEGGT